MSYNIILYLPLLQNCPCFWLTAIQSSNRSQRFFIRSQQLAKIDAYLVRLNLLCISLIEASTPPPPPGILRAFDVFSCPGGGNLINLIFPGAGIWSLLIGGGEFDRQSRFHVTSRADSTRDDKSCRRQAFMNSKRKIPDSWRTGWKAKACTSFFLYLKVFKNHLYYLWHVRALS